MRVVFFIIIIFSSFLTFGQTSYKQKAGDIIETKTQRKKFTDTITDINFIDNKGNIFEVFKGVRGGLYVYKISKKTGKRYKYYLPKKNETE